MIASACWKSVPYFGILLVALWMRLELAQIRSEFANLKGRTVAEIINRGEGKPALVPSVPPPRDANLGAEPPAINMTFKLDPIDEEGLRRLEESASLQTEETYGPFFGELDGYTLEDIEALKAILNEQRVQSSLVGREMVGLPRDEAGKLARRLMDIENEKNERLRATLSPEDYQRFEVYNLSRSYKPQVDAMLNRMQSRLVPVARETRHKVLEAYSKAMLESSRSGRQGEADESVEERMLYNVIKEVSPLLDERQLDAFTEELSKDS